MPTDEERRKEIERAAQARAAEERRKQADAAAERETNRIRAAVQKVVTEATKATLGAGATPENLNKQIARIQEAERQAALAMDKLNKAHRAAGGSSAASERITQDQAQARRRSRMRTWDELFGKKPPGQRDKRTGNEDHGSWWA